MDKPFLPAPQRAAPRDHCSPSRLGSLGVNQETNRAFMRISLFISHRSVAPGVRGERPRACSGGTGPAAPNMAASGGVSMATRVLRQWRQSPRPALRRCRADPAVRGTPMSLSLQCSPTARSPIYRESVLTLKTSAQICKGARQEKWRWSFCSWKL